MDRISTIWRQLELQRPEAQGLLRIRYSAELTAEVFLGLLTAERERCLLLRVNAGILKSSQPDRSLRGLKIEKIADPLQPDSVFLTLILLNPHAQEIFDTLIQDIINKVMPLADEKRILKTFIERIDTWRSLFEKPDPETLSTEARQGLYGELYFLRKWILNSPEDKSRCVYAWLGVDKDLRDFQSGNWAIEVKTTRGNNHQKIQVASERQLDPSLLDKLWLYHLSLEVQQKNGENLNQIVDAVIELLKEDVPLVTELKSRLLKGGYFTIHRPFYEDSGYQLRSEAFYIIKDNFPRLEERMIPKGVGDVKYTIILSDYSEYIVNESLVFETIS